MISRAHGNPDESQLAQTSIWAGANCKSDQRRLRRKCVFAQSPQSFAAHVLKWMIKTQAENNFR